MRRDVRSVTHAINPTSSTATSGNDQAGCAIYGSGDAQMFSTATLAVV